MRSDCQVARKYMRSDCQFGFLIKANKLPGLVVVVPGFFFGFQIIYSTKNKKIIKSLQEVILYNFKIKNIYKIDEIICIYLLKSK